MSKIEFYREYTLPLIKAAEKELYYSPSSWQIMKYIEFEMKTKYLSLYF